MPRISKCAKPKKAKPRKDKVSTITSALRRIWLYSAQRQETLKRAGGICEECGTECAKSRVDAEKTGNPMIEVHHVEPCDLTKLAKLVHAAMFPGADKLDALCGSCHKEADAIIRRENAKG